MLVEERFCRPVPNRESHTNRNRALEKSLVAAEVQLDVTGSSSGKHQVVSLAGSVSTPRL